MLARLTGERVVLQDDGSEDAMIDMRIVYADGRVGIVEAWTDTDGSAELMSEGADDRQGRRVVPDRS